MLPVTTATVAVADCWLVFFYLCIIGIPHLCPPHLLSYAPHTFLAFSLVLFFGCCRFESDPNWQKILTSDEVRSVVTRDVAVTAGIEPVDSLQSRMSKSLWVALIAIVPRAALAEHPVARIPRTYCSKRTLNPFPPCPLVVIKSF